MKLDRKTWIILGLGIVVLVLLGGLAGLVLTRRAQDSGPGFELLEWNASKDADGNVLFHVQVENLKVAGQLFIKCEVQTAMGNHCTATLPIDLGIGESRWYDVLVDIPAQDDSDIVNESCTVTEA